MGTSLTKYRAQFAGHAFHSKSGIMTDFLIWKASTPCQETQEQRSVEDLPAAMANKTVWCQIVCDISAIAMT